jgi:hypothetical protein
MFNQRFFEKIARTYFSYLQQVVNSTGNELHRRSILSSATFLENLPEFKRLIFFSDRSSLQEFCITQISDHVDGHSCIEFGVYKGASLKFFSKRINQKFYGFDSFEGLRNSFGGVNALLRFRRNGKKPRFLPKNVELIVGDVENTLENFLKNSDIRVNFIHFDMDVYEPTKYALEALKPFLGSGTLILFDEVRGNINWQFGEYLAIEEVLERNFYEWVAFGPNQGLMRII